MKKDINVDSRKRRSRKGEGYLYKRSSDGTIHPSDWNGQGNFYLAYRTGAADRRKLVRIPLRDAHGVAIANRADAEAERKRLMAPVQSGTEVEALKARLVKAAGELVEAVDNAKDGLTIAGAWETYTANKERPDSGAATLRQYGFQFNRFASWTAAKHPELKTLDAVTREHAQEYATDLLGAGLSGNSVNKHIGLLSLVFRVLADDAGVKVNPWEKIARRKQNSAERRELTTEELRRVIQTADESMKLLFAIGIYTGLRLGDCCTLLWTEIDLVQGFIVRMPHKTASKGKPVRVPLFRDLAAMLSAARKVARGEYVLPELAHWYQSGRGDSITDRIQRHFWNCGIDCHATGTGHQIKRDKDGNPVLTVNGNAVLEPTGKRAVIRCGFHSLRHTFVSLCRQANAPLSVVEAIVGHSNPAMTRHYSHTGDAEAVRAIASLPAMTDKGNDAGTLQQRPEPPQWVIALVESMTAKNWKQIKAELLKGGAI